MTLNNLKCNHLMPVHFKGLIDTCFTRAWYVRVNHHFTLTKNKTKAINEKIEICHANYRALKISADQSIVILASILKNSLVCRLRPVKN